MSKQTIARFRAAIVVIAPAVLFAALAYHPYIPSPTDEAAVAAALVSDTTRWGLAHLGVALGSGLMVLAFLAVRAYLRDAGEERWSILGFPFIVMGSTLFALLPAMEIAMLAAAEVGADAEAAQTALGPWFMPILLSGAILFAVGAFGFARGIVVSGVLSRGLAWLVAGALVIMAVTRFVPLGASLYLGGIAGILALWPLAGKMANRSSDSVGYSRPVASSKA
jgi:hypothetical protein